MTSQSGSRRQGQLRFILNSDYPSYNFGCFCKFDNTIINLVNQTLDGVEIICINDGSPDNCLNILKEYQANYPDKNIVIIDKKNEGVWKGRFDGIAIAKGEYIGFTDSDDYIALDYAEKLYNAAKKNNADLAVCGFERIDLETNTVVATNMTNFGNTVKEINQKDDFVLFINPAPWNKVYKREKIKDLRFLPFRGFNDTMFLNENVSFQMPLAFRRRSTAVGLKLLYACDKLGTN